MARLSTANRSGASAPRYVCVPDTPGEGHVMWAVVGVGGARCMDPALLQAAWGMAGPWCTAGRGRGAGA